MKMLGTPSLLLLVLGLRRDYASSKYDNWVKNISFRQLDETETQVLPYGLKHSITPRRIPIETIVSSVEAHVLAHQIDLTESTKARNCGHLSGHACRSAAIAYIP